MKKLLTLLIIICSFQVSGQTWEQVKTFIDSQTEQKVIKVDAYWNTIYRNEIYKRASFGDSILILKNYISQRKEIPKAWLAEQIVSNDTMFIPELKKASFRKVLFYSSVWEYQQKVEVFTEKTMPKDKNEVLLLFFKKANNLSLQDSLYTKGINYIQNNF